MTKIALWHSLVMRDDGIPVGPSISTAGSIDVSTFQTGTAHTITAGTASATGGGSVSYEYRHYVSSDDTTLATTAAYTYLVGNVDDFVVAQWRAVETGGTNAGETPWQTVGSGTISEPSDEKWVITGHSITDDWTIKAGFGNNGTEDLAAADGITYTEYLASGAYSSAQYRWTNSASISPDIRSTLNTVSGLTYLVGIEAMNDTTGLETYVTDYGGGAEAFVYGLLWHEAAEDAGCTNHYYVRWHGANNAYGGFNQSWRDAITDEEWPRWDSIKTYIDANKTGSLPFTFVYLDAAVAVLFDRIQAGTYTEFAIGDFFSDNVHFSDLGQYLALKYVWCTIRGTLPTAYTALTYGGMSSSITTAQRDEIDDLIADVIADPTIALTSGASAPDAFGASDWSVADADIGGTATVTISSLPANNGASITRIDYRINGSSWVDSGVTTATTFDITGLTDGVQVTVDLRAANSAGNGTDSDDKTVTPTAGVPDAFVLGDWSVADATTGGTVTVTISSLPANNGAAISQIDYRVDAGTWTDSGVTTATTFNIGSLTDDTQYTIELRATNSAGSSGDSDDKTVTPTTAASSPATYGGLSEVSATRTGTSLPVSLAGLTSTSSDIIIAILVSDQDDGGATYTGATASAGWTEIGSVYDSGYVSLGVKAFWAQGDVSSLTLTINNSGELTRPVILVEVEDADTTTPIAASSFDNWGDDIGSDSASDMTTASITAVEDGFVIAGYVTQQSAETPGSAATNYTNRLDMQQGDYTGIAGLALQTRDDTPAGATGTLSHGFTTGAWESRQTFIIAVNGS